jgi:hypothetical protein
MATFFSARRTRMQGFYFLVLNFELTKNKKFTRKSFFLSRHPTDAPIMTVSSRAHQDGRSSF